MLWTPPAYRHRAKRRRLTDDVSGPAAPLRAWERGPGPSGGISGSAGICGDKGPGFGPLNFSPLQIAGCVLWLRSDLGVTFVQGPVVATGTTPPAVTLTGTPLSRKTSIQLICTAAGTQTTATFAYYLNGVFQNSFTSAAAVVLGTTGITANFPVGAYTNTPSADTYNSVVTVSAWADESGAGNNVTQATAALQPAYTNGTNQKPGVTGDGVSQYLKTAGNLSTAVATWFVVAFTSTQGAFERAMIGGNNGTSNGHILYTNSANVQALFNGSSSGGPLNATMPAVYGVLTGGAGGMYWNGQLIGGVNTTWTADNTPLCACGDPTNAIYSDGPVIEVIGYSGVLAAAQFSTVGRYLASRYNIAGTW